MSEAFGDDFITITDEDGKEYELEVLASVEYNGATYLGVCPADQDETDEIEVSILKTSFRPSMICCCRKKTKKTRIPKPDFRVGCPQQFPHAQKCPAWFVMIPFRPTSFFRDACFFLNGL